jgi:hypothetical protein
MQVLRDSYEVLELANFHPPILTAFEVQLK